MTDKLALSYVEIDIPYCEHSFGESPCVAVGDKCFNTRNNSLDCGDPANFSPTTKTIRFGINCGYLPDIDCIPCLESAVMSPAELDIGNSIGKQSTLKASFFNLQHSDVGLDKYISDRAYNPYDTGTFWGKFTARNPYLKHVSVRFIRGFLGQSLAEMEVHHFFLDKITGPDSGGKVVFSCVDAMRLIDKETSQIPAPSPYRLTAPAGAGIGTIYVDSNGDTLPVSGAASIGNEIVTFTNNFDGSYTCLRAQHGTTTADHDIDATFQLCFQASGVSLVDLLESIIIEHTPIPASLINTQDWINENANLPILYSGLIAKPTAVKSILNELCLHGVTVYADTEENQIKLSVIRPVTSNSQKITDDLIINGSLSVGPAGKRFSQVWLSFSEIDKSKNKKEISNFRTTVIAVDSDSQYSNPEIKKIYSRWLPPGAVSAANEICNLYFSRYRIEPRKIELQTPRGYGFHLSQGVTVESGQIESATGEPESIRCQITKMQRGFDRDIISMEEVTFIEQGPATDRLLYVETSTQNLNLRELYDQIYLSVNVSVNTVFYVNTGVIVGSSSTELPALDSGIWPTGYKPKLVNMGFIVGKGGNARAYMSDAGTADGGLALRLSDEIEIDNTAGVIGGGGGGGALHYLPPDDPGEPDDYELGGGGGAGFASGKGGYTSPEVSSSGAEDGALELGGAGASNNPGGDLGQSGGGLTASGGAVTGAETPGAAGAAVSGDSFATWLALGDVRGARV